MKQLRWRRKIIPNFGDFQPFGQCNQSKGCKRPPSGDVSELQPSAVIDDIAVQVRLCQRKFCAIAYADTVPYMLFIVGCSIFELRTEKQDIDLKGDSDEMTKCFLLPLSSTR